MATTLRVFAPAKINLFLHILGQNPNGYHHLQTIFQLLNFGDYLTFERSHDPSIHCIAPGCPWPIEENLVYRAAKLLQQHYHCTQGVTIHLEKNIPTGAGLGGGSSDAGATLRALNELWQLNASRTELMRLGKELGADVPIFVFDQNAWAEGIGEQLTPLHLPIQNYLIINPRCMVSTQSIFQHPALPRNTTAIMMQDYNFNQTHNDCEALVCALYPDIAAAKTWLSQFGTARLTGTGGCLFLAVASKEMAQTIAAQVPKKWDVISCESLP